MLGAVLEPSPNPPDAGPGGATASGVATAVGRRRYGLEILIVLGVSLGASAVWSVLAIIEKATRPQPIGQQTTSMNNSVTPDRPWLDLAYQVANIVLPLMPAFLALYLLWLSGDRRRVGFDLRRPWFDLGRGFAVFAAIGVPGLAFYYAARYLGINTDVQPANLAAHWWTIPAYAGLALMNGVLEEVVMLAYLITRLRQLRWAPWAAVLTSAAIRGTYHLYQGYGGGIGNLVMGLAFGALFLRWRRAGPLVVAHVLLDLASFIGYALLAPYLPRF